MTTLTRHYWLSAALLISLSGAAQAQLPFGPQNNAWGGMVPPTPPAFSPYLNLNRQGASPAVNYYGLVRPQLQFRNAIQGLQSQTTQVNPFVQATAADQTLITGHQFGFMNSRMYFQNQNSAGSFGNYAGSPNRFGFQGQGQGQGQGPLATGGNTAVPQPRRR
jgi:hypothetical protein